MKNNKQYQFKRIVEKNGKTYLFPIDTPTKTTKRFVKIGKNVYEFPEIPKRRVRKK